MEPIFMGNCEMKLESAFDILNGWLCRPWSAPELRRSSGGKLVGLVAFDQWDEKSKRCLLHCWGECEVHSVPTASCGGHWDAGEEVTSPTPIR